MSFNNFFLYRKSDSLSLKFLKTITVLAPATFITLFELIRHTIFIEREPMLMGNLILIAVVTIAAYLFSRFIFGIIERIQQESLRRNQELTAINSVALAVSESLNLDVVLYQALDKLLQITTADAGELFLLDEQTREMVQRVHSGLFREAFLEKTRFKVGEGLPGKVIQDGQPVVIAELSVYPDFLRDLVRKSGFHSVACVPLKSQGTVIGAINIFSLNPRHFTANDISLLTGIGNQIAVAIENARLHERVQGMATLEERGRISREMHDGLAQVLSYVLAKSQAAKQFIASGQTNQAETQLGELENITQEVYADVREAILGLRTTTSPHKDMITTLQEYVFHFGQMTGIRAEMEIDNSRALHFPITVELQLMRIIQEALTNIRKHARASQAWIRISSDQDKASITIEDNGRGFNVSHIVPSDRPQFGLKIMQERAESVRGSLAIEAIPGQGTRVNLVIPLAQEEKI